MRRWPSHQSRETTCGILDREMCDVPARTSLRAHAVRSPSPAPAARRCGRAGVGHGWNGGEESWDESEEVGELTEEEVAVVENWEDEKLTKMINEESAMVEEAGGPGVKLCFVCRGPHLARVCPQRLKNVSSAMGRMGVVPRWRGSKKGRGGWTKGASRGRSGSLSGHPLQLPPPSTLRPISSSQPGHKRADF